MSTKKSIVLKTAEDERTLKKIKVLGKGKLSATVMKVLREYVEIEEAKTKKCRQVIVKVGEGKFVRKRFFGRLLIKKYHYEGFRSLLIVYSVYVTMHGRFIIHMKRLSSANYTQHQQTVKQYQYKVIGNSARSVIAEKAWKDWEDSHFGYYLEVYENLEELKKSVPPEVFGDVEYALHDPQDDIETLAV